MPKFSVCCFCYSIIFLQETRYLENYAMDIHLNRLQKYFYAPMFKASHFIIFTSTNNIQIFTKGRGISKVPFVWICSLFLPDCGLLTGPTHGTVNLSDTLEGDKAKYVCHPTYYMTSGSAVRTCQKDRTWSGEEPFCSLTGKLHIGKQ